MCHLFIRLKEKICPDRWTKQDGRMSHEPHTPYSFTEPPSSYSWFYSSAGLFTVRTVTVETAWISHFPSSENWMLTETVSSPLAYTRLRASWGTSLTQSTSCRRGAHGCVRYGQRASALREPQPQPQESWEPEQALTHHCRQARHFTASLLPFCLVVSSSW